MALAKVVMYLSCSGAMRQEWTCGSPEYHPCFAISIQRASWTSRSRLWPAVDSELLVDRQVLETAHHREAPFPGRQRDGERLGDEVSRRLFPEGDGRSAEIPLVARDVLRESPVHDERRAVIAREPFLLVAADVLDGFPAARDDVEVAQERGGDAAVGRLAPGVVRQRGDANHGGRDLAVGLVANRDAESAGVGLALHGAGCQGEEGCQRSARDQKPADISHENNPFRGGAGKTACATYILIANRKTHHTLLLTG